MLTLVAVAFLALVVARAVARVHAHIDPEALIATVVRSTSKAEGPARLRRLASFISGPSGDLLRRLVDTWPEGSAPDLDVARSKLEEIAQEAFVTWTAKQREIVRIDVVLFAVSLVLAAGAGFAATREDSASRSALAAAAAAVVVELALIGREITTRRSLATGLPAALDALAVIAAGKVALPSATSPALNALGGGAEPVARVPAPPAPRAAPSWCAACGGRDFARGAVVMLRGIASSGIDRIDDLPHVRCQAVVCLTCGRVDWYVERPNDVFGDGISGPSTIVAMERLPVSPLSAGSLRKGSE